MATPRFRMDPDRMEALSRELDGLYRADFSGIVAALQVIDDRLDQAWVGGSRQAFQAQFGGWLRATEPLGLSLVHVAHFLREAAAEYRRLDVAVAPRELVPDRARAHAGRETGPARGGPPPGWEALLTSLTEWQVMALNHLLDLWQRGLPAPFVRGGGGVGASVGAIALDLPDWLQAIVDWLTGAGDPEPADLIPQPQVNNLGEEGCVTTDEDGNVLYNLLCSPPEPQAEPSFLEWLFGAGQAPLVPGGPLVDVPVLVPGQGQGNDDDDEPGTGSSSGGAGPRGGAGGDDILDGAEQVINATARTLTPAEQRVANELAARGAVVEVLPVATGDGVRSPDFLINGEPWELKTITNITSDNMESAIARRAREGAEQASNVILDVRGQPGFTEEMINSIAERAFRGEGGQLLDRLMILGDGWSITVTRQP